MVRAVPGGKAGVVNQGDQPGSCVLGGPAQCHTGPAAFCRWLPPPSPLLPLASVGGCHPPSCPTGDAATGYCGQLPPRPSGPTQADMPWTPHTTRDSSAYGHPQWPPASSRQGKAESGNALLPLRQLPEAIGKAGSAVGRRTIPMLDKQRTVPHYTNARI